MDKDNAALSCMGAVTGLLILLVGGAALDGFTISILWRWFAVPLFGLPALTLWQALGVSLLASAITSNNSDFETDDDDPFSAFVQVLLYFVMKAGILLGMGWIIRGLAF